MSTLMLRDIHQPPAPGWWPPAPGWWWLAAGVIACTCAWIAWRRHRARRHARIAAVFDAQVDAASTPALQLAAMSDLLRRAARAHHADADALQGDAWLHALDTPRRRRGTRRVARVTAFTDGVGRLLLDGPFRAHVDAHEVEAVRAVARARFLDWMGVR